MKPVYIVAYSRTPIGSFGGSLATLTATELGRQSVTAALNKSGIEAGSIEEIIYGNVCQANVGQAPARQVALGAGLRDETITSTINKVCASGMKAIALGSQAIELDQNGLIIAGGMESMSNIPFYLPALRWGNKYGNTSAIDGLSRDGLTDVYTQQAMGVFADATAKEFNISREAQDEYAINSYKRAEIATLNGKFKNEIDAVSIPQRKGDPILMVEDEEFRKVQFDKIPGLRPAFTKDGTVTAANASTINDGAATVILASEEIVKKHQLTPIARIVSYADAEQAPEWFTTAPTEAAPKALRRAGLSVSEIDYFEVNEAFSVVAMAFIQKMNIDAARTNIYGGAVALGHPLGCSGARIVCTLISALHNEGGRYGLAAICNGGGGASAMVIERL